MTQNLLGKPGLEDCELTEIRQLVNQYPWMTAARLLLVKKMMLENENDWPLELEKTSLYIGNRHWLHYLLNETSITEAAVPVFSPTASQKAKEELLFEPFHTVDYFASQGIRFKIDEQPTDKFGQQLKSFTDWIKTMKKLPLSEIGKSVDPKEERKVEQLAGRSLEQQEVVTEAMADIWIKQRNFTKAREIYQKLSLLEPAKSAYFVSKIDELK
ncbi:MAG: hypothetical protein ACO3AY_05765 [Chitinophagaceae bacterium]